jgi:hypothetical protein
VVQVLLRRDGKLWKGECSDLQWRFGFGCTGELAFAGTIGIGINPQRACLSGFQAGIEVASGRDQLYDSLYGTSAAATKGSVSVIYAESIP